MFSGGVPDNGEAVIVWREQVNWPRSAARKKRGQVSMSGCLAQGCFLVSIKRDFFLSVLWVRLSQNLRVTCPRILLIITIFPVVGCYNSELFWVEQQGCFVLKGKIGDSVLSSLTVLQCLWGLARVPPACRSHRSDRMLPILGKL